MLSMCAVERDRGEAYATSSECSCVLCTCEQCTVEALLHNIGLFVYNKCECVLKLTIECYSSLVLHKNKKPLRCGHPSIMAKEPFPNGGHYRGVPLCNILHV